MTEKQLDEPMEDRQPACLGGEAASLALCPFFGRLAGLPSKTAWQAVLQL